METEDFELTWRTEYTKVLILVILNNSLYLYFCDEHLACINIWVQKKLCKFFVARKNIPDLFMCLWYTSI